MGKLNTAVIAGIGMLAIGCSGQTTDGPESLGLNISVQDATHFAGTYTTEDMTVTFDVAEVDKGVIDGAYEVGDILITSRLDNNEGLGSYDFGEASLTEMHRNAIQEANEAIALALGEKDLNPAEDQAKRQTSYLAESPIEQPMPAFDFSSDRGWSYISCSCYNQYIGSGYYRTSGRGWTCGGGNGCKGRCGTGCQFIYSGKYSAYTRDCAKHDHGVGSFWAASDDFSFAGNNCINM